MTYEGNLFWSAWVELTKERQLRREWLSLRTHYFMLGGLATFAMIRMRDYVEALETIGEDTPETLEKANAIRQYILSQHIKKRPMSRMLYDQYTEIDLYSAAPFELFFCAAQAFVEKYQILKSQHHLLSFPELDSYIKDNQESFDAVANLRDWVLHPGHRRNPDDAMAVLFSERAKTHSGNPYDMIQRLLDLYGKFLGIVP